MKVLEFLRGTGIVTAPDGNEFPARYDLQITQDEPPGGGVRTGAPPIVRHKHLSGQVWSEGDPYFVSTHVRKIMMLKMEDGRKFNFFHREMDGSIGLSKWLG